MQDLRKYVAILLSTFLAACAASPRINAHQIRFLDKETSISNEYREFDLTGKLLVMFASDMDIVEFGNENKYHVFSEVRLCESGKRMTGNFSVNPISSSESTSSLYFVIADYKTDTNDPAIGTGKISNYDLAEKPENICLQVRFGGIGKIGRESNKIVFPMTSDIVSSIRRYEPGR